MGVSSVIVGHEAATTLVLLQALRRTASTALSLSFSLSFFFVSDTLQTCIGYHHIVKTASRITPSRKIDFRRSGARKKKIINKLQPGVREPAKLIDVVSLETFVAQPRRTTCSEIYLTEQRENVKPSSHLADIVPSSRIHWNIKCKKNLRGRRILVRTCEEKNLETKVLSWRKPAADRRVDEYTRSVTSYFCLGLLRLENRPKYPEAVKLSRVPFNFIVLYIYIYISIA